MPLETMSSQECLVIFAYLNFLQSLNRKQATASAVEGEAKTDEFGPPRREKGNYPLKRPNYTLDDLLAQVTEDNVHEEIDTGPAVGKEEW